MASWKLRPLTGVPLYDYAPDVRAILRIQLHAPDGGHVATAPVEVQPSVIVRPLTGVPLYDYAPDVRAIGDWMYFCASRQGEICDFYRTKDRRSFQLAMSSLTRKPLVMLGKR